MQVRAKLSFTRNVCVIYLVSLLLYECIYIKYSKYIFEYPKTELLWTYYILTEYSRDLITFSSITYTVISFTIYHIIYSTTVLVHRKALTINKYITSLLIIILLCSTPHYHCNYYYCRRRGRITFITAVDITYHS